MCQKLVEFLIKCIVCNTVTHLPVICLWKPTIYLISSLENAHNNLFLDSQLNYQHCLLPIDCNTIAIFKTFEGIFFTLIQEIHMAYHTHLENVCKFLLKI